MKFNVNVFKGGDEQFTVKVFKMFEDDLVMIPDGSIILASEVVDKLDVGQAQVWVWAAVPNDNMGVANGTKKITTEPERSVSITGEPVPQADPRLVKLRDEYLSVIPDSEIDELDSQWANVTDDYVDDDEEDSSEDDE